ncbi:uncharacterized protein LOC110099590 [Dendrobium catenatum]|uniref:uncharacterized protein LOC110099590 n=1 Tax=Dendrobium catenatum TaxID=906689 RepID=UPI0009F36F26|nr:uncharacterized protein LOC110099590 [Dendrobium catenatum]
MPFSKGGLGIASFHALRSAFNCDTILRIYNLDSQLFRWFKIRYSSPWKPTPRHSTAFWKSLQITANLFKSNFKFHVIANSSIAILWDNWSSNGSLLDSFPHFDYTSVIQDSTILAKWMDGYSWSLRTPLTSQMADFITSTPIANSGSRHLTWENNENATFKDFYKEYFAFENDVDWAFWVWHKKHSLRHSVYSWMALSNGLKTLAALSARNIVIRDVSCPLCHLHPETTAHLLLECDYSFQVICKLIPQFTSFLFRPNLAQAFQFISGIDSTKKVKLGLLLILNVTEYFIWIERNSRKYNGRISCAITLAKKISSVVYLKLNSWKCGNSVKEKLMVKYH